MKPDCHQPVHQSRCPYTYADPTGEGLACGDDGQPGCGTGVVTHGDGSLSKDGRPTGGGIIHGGMASTRGVPQGGCAVVRCNGGGPGHAFGGTASPNSVNTDSRKSTKGASEHMAWYENWNNFNGANGLATLYWIFTDQKCHQETSQTVCFGSSPGGVQPMTIGDVLFTGQSKEGWSARLDNEKRRRREIRATRGSEAADSYGPDVYRHEAIHTKQWRNSPLALTFIGEYGMFSAYSEWKTGEPYLLNPYELQAGLSWGSYKP